MNQLPASQLHPLHVPRTILFAIACLFCFIKFGFFDVNHLNSSEAREPYFLHLGHFGTSAGSLLNDLDICAQSGRAAPVKVNTALHALIDILERNRYWKTSETFAASLREVVDSEPEQEIPRDVFQVTTQLSRAGNGIQLNEVDLDQNYATSTIKVVDAATSDEVARQNVAPPVCQRCQQHNKPHLCIFKSGENSCVLCVRDKKGCRVNSEDSHTTLIATKRRAISEDDQAVDLDSHHRRFPKRVKASIGEDSRTPYVHRCAQLHGRGFNEVFPSCTSCYNASVNCQMPYAGKKCGRCREHGLPCVKRERPYMSLSVATIDAKGQSGRGTSSCRRCLQKEPDASRAMAQANRAINVVATTGTATILQHHS